MGLGQWFPNCEPWLPWEPRFLPGELQTITVFLQILSFFIILFQFADVDILQSILDMWSHMLRPICSAIMCCVYDSLVPDCMLPSKLIGH